METQTDKLRGKQEKITPLYTKKVRYVGIHKVIERANPFTIYLKQNYWNHQVNEYCRREVPKPLDNPAHYEIHLAADTVTASIGAMNQYNLPVAVSTNIMGSTRPIIGQRHGIGVYIFGEEGQEDVYFVLTWKDVLKPPNVDPKILADKRKVVEKKFYPQETFARTEEGRRVYYANKADPETRTLILEALHRNKADVKPTADDEGHGPEPLPES